MVLANRLPYPLDDGWKVRTFHVIQQISKWGPITLLVFDDGGSQDDLEGFRQALGGTVDVVCVPRPRPYTVGKLIRGAFSRWPIQYWNHRSTAFRQAVNRVCQSQAPALAVATSTFMFPYLEDLDSIALRVIDTHNIDSELMRRYVPHLRGPLRRAYARITAKKLENLEDRTFMGADRVWVCSEDEAVSLQRRGQGIPVRVIPNGVDVARFSEVATPIDRRRLLYFGKLDYIPNADALQYFVTRIAPLLGDLEYELVVVGSGASRETEETCQTLSRVRLVGRVDDVRPWLASAAAVVVPLRMGSGTRLKILEAMAAGRPVISTTIGAEGIVAEPERDFLKADDAAAFAAAIRRVLENPDLGDRIGAAGRAAVRRRYAWESIGSLILHDLTGAVNAD